MTLTDLKADRDDESEFRDDWQRMRNELREMQSTLGQLVEGRRANPITTVVDDVELIKSQVSVLQKQVSLVGDFMACFDIK